MHLIEAELDREVAAGRCWRSKAMCAETLVHWIAGAHPGAPQPTAKAIQNRLGSKMPISRY
jgi:hypothetical protein